MPELDSRNLTDDHTGGRRNVLLTTIVYHTELLDIIDKIDLFMFLLTGLPKPTA